MSRTAQAGSALPSTPHGGQESSPPSSVTREVIQGGCNGGNGNACPPCPTAAGRETGRVVGASAASAACSGETSPEEKLRSGSKQVRLVLPGTTLRDMEALAPTCMGDLLRLLLVNSIGDLRSLPQLVSSAGQVGRLGVLLAQTLPYGFRTTDMATLVPEIEDVLPTIQLLSLPRQKEYKSESADDESENGPLRQRGRWAGVAMSLRLRLPVEFADSLLEMPPDLRSRALWLALNRRVVASFDLQKLIACEARIIQAGRELNQALRQAGKENELEELAPAAQEVLATVRFIQKFEWEGGGR